MWRTPLLAIVALCLGACQLVGGTPIPPPTLDSDAMTRVAIAVQATSDALAAQNAAAPAPTRTPAGPPISASLLTAENLNVLLGVWPMTPTQTSAPTAHPYCLRTCVEALWITLDGRGTLQIDLFEFATHGQVVEQLREIRATQEILDLPVIGLPETSVLPDESWVQDNGGTGSRYTLHTLQGRALVILTMYLPDYNETENVLFLSLYGEKQVEELARAGW